MSTVKNITNLSFNDRESRPVHRLPFVGYPPERGAHLSFWNVPRTGGYTGGCRTGSALAAIYMKHLKEHGRGSGGGNLQSIVLDMFDCQYSDDPEVIALRGQIVGFFTELEPWLEAAAQSLDGGLDTMDPNVLLTEANEGLSPDQDDYIDSLLRERRKAQA